MLRCPDCGSSNYKTIDSRDSRAIGRLRRRVCLNCGGRFTTREVTEIDYKRIVNRQKDADALLNFMDEVLQNGHIPRR